MKISQKTLLNLKTKNKKLKARNYKKLKGTISRPRLSVYRSNQNIYAQIINDIDGHTLVSCSTLDRSMKLSVSTGRTCDTARLIGEKLAQASLKKNITKIVFDRSLYFYHGRIKALAEGARAGGLKF